MTATGVTATGVTASGVTATGAGLVLDAGVVTRCRRRVHLDHDPDVTTAGRADPDPSVRQRIADAAVHRRAVADALAARLGPEWVEVPVDAPPPERQRATLAALRAVAGYVWGGLLPVDAEGRRRGGVELLVRVHGGYLPVIVVRHRVTDPGSGALTTPLNLAPGGPLPQLRPATAAPDPDRKARPQPRDALRLAHATRMLAAAGFAAGGPALGGVVGMDADVVLWHELDVPSWPDGRSTLAEYDARFADRLAVAGAATSGAAALAAPSRITECRWCTWWPVCEAELVAVRDVSLVVRGEDAGALRAVGVSTVDDLAALDRFGPEPAPLAGVSFVDSVPLARAWQRGLRLVRRARGVTVPRADVEVDVDMESFGESGAYLWGCWLSGADVGESAGYRAFATWDPLPTADEARSFAAFWTWLTGVRATAAARGLSFRAYCYNEQAENRWLLSSAERFAGMPGIPGRGEVREFIGSAQWVDLYAAIDRQFLCAQGKGLKRVAPVAGFAWRDAEAGGENSMRWYRDAVGLDGAEPDEGQRRRLLVYNEDDVLATLTLRRWMSSDGVLAVPYAGDL